MPVPRHLLIPYAASAAPASRDALAGLRLPHLERLLARLTPADRQSDPEDEERPPALPHERALAQALGLDGTPGRTPWAAHSLLDEGRDPGASAWAFITPCHWQIGMDRVTLAPADALQLADTESRELLAAMAPYFAEDGIDLEYERSSRWRARGEIFRDLVTASPERVAGQNVRPWLPQARAARPLARLQSEMQMLLYTHAVNDARAERRLPPVNAFWVHGAGALTVPPAAPAVARPVVESALRDAALREDWRAWSDAWRRVDAGACKALLDAAEGGSPVTLTLCSERSSWTFQTLPQGLWGRISSIFSRSSANSILETL